MDQPGLDPQLFAGAIIGDDRGRARTSRRILPDTPTSNDEFDSHSRLASAVADTIRGHERGCAIAIEGAYGSGKSSVIEMLREELAEKAQVFVFDAWEHHGDPLRLVYLQELCRFLRHCEWIDSKREAHWEGVFDEIRHRRVVKTKLEVPQPETRDLFAIALLLFIPSLVALATILAQVLSQPSPAWIGEWLRPPQTNLWAWSALLPALMAGIVPGILLRTAFQRRRLEKDGKGVDRSTPLLGFFTGKTLGQSREVENASGSQTSIEFQAHFRGLIADALAGSESKRLVLVVDNLDRLEPDEAKLVWANMRVFTDRSRAARKGDPRERTWLVVPYDRASLGTLWSSNTEGKAGNFDAFIDKTFPVRFQVPTFLLVKWERYFKERLGLALPHWSTPERASEAGASYAVMAATFDAIGRPPTPRELSTVLNEVAAVVAQRGESCTVPLQTIFHFVLLCRDKGGPDEVRAAIQEGNAVPHHLKGILGEGADIALAKLAFGTLDDGHASEVLLWFDLADSLRRGDFEKLAQIATRPWFGTVFANNAWNLVDRLTASSISLPVAARTILDSKLPAIDRPELRASLRRIAERFSELLPGSQMNWEYGAGAAAIVELSPSIEITQRVFQRVFAGPVPMFNANTNVVTLDIARGYGHLIQAALKVGHLQEVTSHISIDLAPEVAVRTLGALGLGDLSLMHLPRFVRISGDRNEVVEALLPSNTRLPWDTWRSAALEFGLKIGLEIPPERISTAMKNTISALTDEQASSGLLLLRLARKLLVSSPEVLSDFERFVLKQGLAANFAGLALKENKETHAAEWLSLVAPHTALDSMNAPKGEGPRALERVKMLAKSGREDDSLLESIVTNRVMYGGGDLLRHLVTGGNESRRLACLVVRFALRGGFTGRILSAETVVNQWPKLRLVLDQEGDLKVPEAEFLKAVRMDLPIREEMERTDLKWPVANLAWEALRSGYGADEVFCGMIETKLGSWNLETWRSELAARPDVSLLYSELKKQRPDFQLPISGRDAFFEVARQVADGSVTMSAETVEAISLAVRAMSDSESTMLGRRILDALQAWSRPKFDQCAMAFDHAVYLACCVVDPGEFLRKTQFIIDLKLSAEGEWLSHQIARTPRLLTESAPDELEDFVMRVKVWSKENKDNPVVHRVRATIKQALAVIEGDDD